MQLFIWFDGLYLKQVLLTLIIDSIMKVSTIKKNYKGIILNREMVNQQFRNLLKKKCFLIPLEEYTPNVQVVPILN